MIRILIALAVPVAAAAMFLACGGDDEPADSDSPGTATAAGGDGDGNVGGGDQLTLEEYFNEVDGIFERSDQEIDALNDELSEATTASTTVAEGVTAISDFLRQSIQVLSDAADDLEALNEPEDVREQHDAFLSAVRDGIGQTETLEADLQGVDTDAELEELTTQFAEDFTATEQEADAACTELEQIAASNDIVVDLNCQE